MVSADPVVDKMIFNLKWPDSIESMDNLRNINPAQWEELNKGLFPAYLLDLSSARFVLSALSTYVSHYVTYQT